MSLAIRALKSARKKVENPPLMSSIGLEHPFSMTIVGVTGSGKTNLCCQLILEPQFFGQYFDKIYLFSPTGGADPSFQALGLPQERIITTKMIPKLESIVEELTEEAEYAAKKDKELQRTLIIFEDLSSQRKLMNSTVFKKAFVQSRHLGISTIACTHKMKSLERTCRINCGHLMLFPCTLSEQAMLYDEHSTSEWTKKDFKLMCSEAFTPEEPDNMRPFLWVNNKAPVKDRFRKSLSEYLRPP